MFNGGSYLTMRQKCLMCMYKVVLIHSERIFPDFVGKLHNHIGGSIFRAVFNITLVASRLPFLKYDKIQMSSSFLEMMVNICPKYSELVMK
jgi:hypothetical protein